MTSYKGQITGLASPFLESFRMNAIREHVAGGKILDFGCGTGKFSGILHYDQYVGVDIDPDCITMARSDHATKRNVIFISNNEFSHIDTRFDYIILSAVIEHFEDPKENMIQLSEKLDRKGKIIITTPTRLGNKILSFGSKFRIFSREGFEEHKYIFTKDDFLSLAIFLNLDLSVYRTFEFGLNQLVILSRKD
jgi:2-polyprenyl-3-methyl-5-hydroxy-6-metoxy-1,4-benzoquinol methylase